MCGRLCVQSPLSAVKLSFEALLRLQKETFKVDAVTAGALRRKNTV